VEGDLVIERMRYAIRWHHPDADGYVSHETEDEKSARDMLAEHEWCEFGTVVCQKIIITEWKVCLNEHA
jgi:hypothetical protein